MQRAVGCNVQWDAACSRVTDQKRSGIAANPGQTAAGGPGGENGRCKPNLSGDAGLKSLIEGADRASCVHDIQGDGSRSRSPVASPCTPARRKSARHDHGTMLDTKLLVNQHTSAAILPSALFLCSLPAPRPLRLIRTSTTPAALMLLTLHVTGSR